MREAVHHWLAAGDPARAGDLVAARWLSRYDSGRLLTARLWLDEFEPGQIVGPPAAGGRGGVAAGAHGGRVPRLPPARALDTTSLDRLSPDGMASLRSSAAILTHRWGAAAR